MPTKVVFIFDSAKDFCIFFMVKPEHLLKPSCAALSADEMGSGPEIRRR